MNWTTLNLPPCPHYLPADLKARHAELTTERDAILAERTAIEEQRSKLESADADKALAGAGKLRQRQAAALQRELELRQRVEEFLQAALPAVNAEATAADTEISEAKRLVAEWLEHGPHGPMGGFGTPNIAGDSVTPVCGSWTPDMLNRHPAVLAARGRFQNADATWILDHRQANSTASNATLLRLEQLKLAALAV